MVYLQIFIGRTLHGKRINEPIGEVFINPENTSEVYEKRVSRTSEGSIISYVLKDYDSSFLKDVPDENSTE